MRRAAYARRRAPHLRPRPPPPPPADGHEGPARRQGSQPGRDGLRPGAAGPARLHHHHRGVQPLHGRRLAPRPGRGAGTPPGPPGEADRAHPRRPRRPAAGLGPVRRQVLHARDDGHDPEPRPQRPQRAGPGRRHGRRPVRLPLLRAAAVHVRQGRARGGRRRRSTTPWTRPRPRRVCPTSPASTPPRGRPCAASTRRCIRAGARKAFPQDPQAQLRGAIEAVFRSWNGARAVAYREREHISHDLGTAVNVQAMVFGNRDDDSGTGVAFTRNAATGTNVPYGDFLVNAQGEDVVAGVRITEPLHAMADPLPRPVRGAGRLHGPPGGATTGTCWTWSSRSSRVGCGCCSPGWASGPALAALRMAAEMTDRPQHQVDPGRGGRPHQPRPARPGPAPAHRRHRPGRPDHRSGRVARGRGRARWRSPPTTRWPPRPRVSR